MLVNRLKYFSKVQKFLGILLVLVLSFQVFNKITWQHVHLLPDGSMVAHAHPYNKSDDTTPFKHHHHNQVDIHFFQILEILFPFVLSGCILVHGFEELGKLVQPSISLETIILSAANGRSPPYQAV